MQCMYASCGVNIYRRAIKYYNIVHQLNQPEDFTAVSSALLFTFSSAIVSSLIVRALTVVLFLVRFTRIVETSGSKTACRLRSPMGVDVRGGVRPTNLWDFFTCRTLADFGVIPKTFTALVLGAGDLTKGVGTLFSSVFPDEGVDLSGDIVTTFLKDFVMVSILSGDLSLAGVFLDGDFPLDNVFFAGDFALEGVFFAGDFALEGVFLAGDLTLEGVFFAGDFALEGVFMAGDLALEGVFLAGDFALEGVFLAGDLALDGVLFAGDFALDGVFRAGDFPFEKVFLTGDFCLAGVFLAADLLLAGVFFSGDLLLGGDFLGASTFGATFAFSRCGEGFDAAVNRLVTMVVALEGVCLFLGVAVFLLLAGVFFTDDLVAAGVLYLKRGVRITCDSEDILGVSTFWDFDVDLRFFAGDFDAPLFLVGDFDGDLARFFGGDFCLDSFVGLGIFVTSDFSLSDFDSFTGEALLRELLSDGVIFLGEGFFGEELRDADFFFGGDFLVGVFDAAGDFDAFAGDLLGNLLLRADLRTDALGEAAFCFVDDFLGDFFGEVFFFGDDFLVGFVAGFEIFVASEDSAFEDFATFAGGGLLGDALRRLVVIFFGDGFFGDTLLDETFFAGKASAGDSLW